MPTYKISLPDGSEYDVDSPNPLSQQELASLIQLPPDPIGIDEPAIAIPPPEIPTSTTLEPTIQEIRQRAQQATTLAGRTQLEPTAPDMGILDLLKATAQRGAGSINQGFHQAATSIAGLATAGNPLVGQVAQPGKWGYSTPGANYLRFANSGVGKQMAENADADDAYWKSLTDVSPETEKGVDFAGGVLGSSARSIPAMVTGVPGLALMSVAAFDPAFHEAIDGGATPEKAFAHAAISWGAEMGAEYLGSAWARTGRILGTQPYLPEGVRKYLGQAPRTALADALKEGTQTVLKRMALSANAEGLEEVATTVVQRLSAAALYDPKQLTNVGDFLSDVMISYAGGAAAGGMFGAVESAAAKRALRGEIQKAIVDQWDSAVAGAKKDGALRPEDEQVGQAAQALRMAMESAVRRGDQATFVQAEQALAQVTSPEVAQATSAEITQAAEAFAQMQTPELAAKFVAQAGERWGPDHPATKRLSQMIGEERQQFVEPAERSFVTARPKLMREMDSTEWSSIVRREGVDLGQVEFRTGQGFVDNQTGMPTDSPRGADGKPNLEQEAWVDPATGRITVNMGSIRGDLPGLTGTKHRRQREHLRQVVREEFAHTRLQTEPGRQLVRDFLSEQMAGPHAEEVRATVASLVGRGYSRRKAPEELLAKLYRRQRGFQGLTDRWAAKIRQWFPSLGPLRPEVAGRLMVSQLMGMDASQMGSPASQAAPPVLPAAPPVLEAAPVQQKQAVEQLKEPEPEQKPAPEPAKAPPAKAPLVQREPKPYPSPPGLPPVPEGHTRFYHGGIPGVGPRWVAPEFTYADNWRSTRGAPPAVGSMVQYVDIPNDHPELRRAYDDTDIPIRAPFSNFEASESITSGFKEVPGTLVEPPPAAPPAPEPAPAPAPAPEPIPAPPAPERDTPPARVLEWANWLIAQDSEFTPVGAARTAQKVLDAIDTGTFGDILRPNNPNARAMFTEITGIKLPKGIRDSQALFTGQPFPPKGTPAPAPPAEIRKGEVGGMMMSSGEVVLTSSGRKTTPFPEIRFESERKALATIKRTDRWLMENALAEAESRGDRFNALQFRANLEKPQKADKDSAEEYLFGQQPAVIPSILKPLVAPTPAPAPAPTPASDQATETEDEEGGDELDSILEILQGYKRARWGEASVRKEAADINMSPEVRAEVNKELDLWFPKTDLGTASSPTGNATATEGVVAPSTAAPDGPLPDWVKEHVEIDWGYAQRAGIVGEIERLSIEQKTAQEIAGLIGFPGIPDLMDKKRVVYAVRNRLGIPSMDDRTEFEAWRNKKLAEQLLAGRGATLPSAAPQPTPEPLTPEQAAKAKADADFDSALADLADVFGTRLNIVPEERQKVFPILVRVFDAAFRKGYYKFKDASRFILKTLRERGAANVADAVTSKDLQGAYIAMSAAVGDQADEPSTVIGITKEQIDAPEPAPAPAPPQAPAPPAPPQLPEVTVERITAAVLAIEQRLAQPTKLTRAEATQIVAQHLGSTPAEGRYAAKDVTDIVEVAVNRLILANPTVYGPNAEGAMAALEQLLERLPTQTTRSAETVERQQFSTPPHLAWLSAWVANIQPTDVMLEPSAGLLGMAVMARAGGARTIIANELSDRRRALAKIVGTADFLLGENAEHLSAILEPKIPAQMPRPTVVVMNPPFSAAAKTDQKSNTVGQQHLEEALRLLPVGGRLVIIMGEGMAADKVRARAYWTELGKKHTIRANIGIDGSEYAKYGTHFGVQLIVIDKTGPTVDSPVVADGLTVAQAVDRLKEVRNVRRPIESGGGQQNQPGAPVSGGVKDAAAQPGNGGVAGRPAGGRPTVAGGVRPGTQQVSGPASAGARTGGGAEPAAPRIGGSDSVAAPTAAAGLNPELENREIADEVFSAYVPTVRIEGAQPHPSPLVEPTAMASVKLPAPTYRPTIDQSMIADGTLSEMQLEQVVYAGQAHQSFLPDGQRQGYFIGDGTGVGKGREIAGIIRDNWNQGRRRAVWISKNGKLFKDASRDLRALGFSDEEMVDFTGKAKLTGRDAGIAFSSYKGISMGNPGVDDHGAINPSDPNKKPRITQLLEWLGPDFDGVIAFDESHLAGNAIDIKGNRGWKRASKQGLAVVDLQRVFPKARIVYVSATGATDVVNLSYAERLGIWGSGTPFPGKLAFFTAIKNGGLSALEIVARDLKALGRYLARTLSFAGVERAQIVHKVTPEQREIYNSISTAWQTVMLGLAETMATTGMANDGRARGQVNAQMFGAQQRCYNQLLTAMQMPSIIREMRTDLEAGHSVVIQLVNTNEAQLERELADKSTDEDEALDLESVDLSPKKVLIEYIENGWPTIKYEPVADGDGNIRWIPVKDAQGNFVQDQDAIAIKKRTLNEIAMLQSPDNPLEQILNTFGEENVSEITGRSKRIVDALQADGSRKKVTQSRTSNNTSAESQEFNDGKRRILVFSGAGGTGFSYHAGLTFKNQQRRMHYLAQAGWRADAAIQGFGRTHRADQVSAPFYKLFSTDIKGHQRFISTIARRLSELGAITGGERKSAGGEMFSEDSNLENDYAEDSVIRLFNDLFSNRVEGFEFNEVAQQLGFSHSEVNSTTGEREVINDLIDDKGSLNVSKIPSVSKFLNRILITQLDVQDRLFEAFTTILARRIENAKADGSYDPGLQQLKAVAVRKVEDIPVYDHPDTGAQTRMLVIEHDHNAEIYRFDQVNGVERYAVNRKSGKVWAFKPWYDRTTDSGAVVKTWSRWGVGSHGPVLRDDINFTDDKDATDGYRPVDASEAKAKWDAEYEKHPKIVTKKGTYISGLVLPIWDRIGLAFPTIWRIPLGRTHILGIEVPVQQVPAMRKRLGAGAAKAMTPAEVLAAVRDSGQKFTLANGWIIRPSRVLGDMRVEVVGLSYGNVNEWRDYIGGFTEEIQYKIRAFIPVDDQAGVPVMERLLKKSPVVEDVDPPSYSIKEPAFGRQPTLDDQAELGAEPPAYSISDSGRPLDADLEEIRREFPSAPPIRVQADGDEAAVYQPDSREIVLTSSWMPSSRASRRAVVLSALADAGLDIIPPSYWDGWWVQLAGADGAMVERVARGLGADITTADGRRQVMAKLVRDRRAEPRAAGAVRALLRRLKLVEGKKSASRVITSMQRALERQIESFTPATPREFERQSPEQVFADANAAVYEVVRPVVSDLEARVRESYGLESSITPSGVVGSLILTPSASFAQFRARLERLAVDAEAATIGAGSRRSFSIGSEDFLEEVGDAGIAVDQGDIDAHEAYRAEIEARKLVTLRRAWEANVATHRFLEVNMPEYPLGPLENRIARQRAALDRAEEERPAIAERAAQIRQQQDAIPAARSAAQALADPQMQQWAEIIHQIEESGATPRAESELSPQLQSNRLTANAGLHYDARSLRRRAADRLATMADKNLAALRKLHARRLALRKKEGEVEVGMVELLQALAGDPGASGGLFTREVAREIRDRDQAIMRLAVALGAERPTTAVSLLRDAMISSATQALGPGARDREPASLDQAVIRQAAADAGIGEQVLTEILRMANRSNDFRNLVLMLADEADRRSDANLLNAIEQLEEARRQTLLLQGPRVTDQPQLDDMGAILRLAARNAWAAASPAMRRLRATGDRLEQTILGIEGRIEELEIELGAAQMLDQAASRVDEMAAADDNRVAEMFYRNKTGEFFEGFVRADGTNQLPIQLAHNREFTPQVVRSLFDLAEQAQLAIDAETNPPEVTRGLEVMLTLISPVIEAGSTAAAVRRTLTPLGLSQALTSSAAGIRQAIPRLIPGISGRRVSDQLARNVRIGNRIDAILDRHHRRHMQLLENAYQSFDLSRVDTTDQTAFDSLYSEAANRLRRFGQAVVPGERLFSDRPERHRQLTTELLTLLRFHRDVFREVQAVMASEPYGGIREQMPTGQRLIRQPAETGDIGLARMVNSYFETELAEEFVRQETIASSGGPAVDMTDWWNRADHFKAVLFHILDSDRHDLAFPRDSQIAQLEIRYARDIREGRAPRPYTLAEVVDALAGYAGHTIANARQTIDQRFREELDRYARVAKSRTGAAPADVHPGDAEERSRAVTRSMIHAGESDQNEFTSPAAQLIYPSNWYVYGAGSDLRQAVDRISQPAKVALLEAMSEAADSLTAFSNRIKAPDAINRLTPEDQAFVIWHTPGYDPIVSGPSVITQGRLNQAAIAAEARAAIVRQEIATESLAEKPRPFFVTRLLRTAYPFLLGSPQAMLTNVVGGPVATYTTLAPIVGRPVAAALSVPAAVLSSVNLASQIVYWAAGRAGINLRGLTSREGLDFLESLGHGLSYSHKEIQEMQQHMLGDDLKSRMLRGAANVADAFERTVGRRIGVAAGDMALNRFAVAVVVPFAIRKLQQRAIRWQSRLAAANVPDGIQTDPRWLFGAEDSASAAAMREMLLEAGLNPEEFLTALARGEVSPRTFWRHPLAAKLGEQMIGDFNASNRSNRPHSNTWLSLLGWTASMSSRALDTFRMPSEAPKFKKWMGAAIAGASVHATLAVSFYAQQVARRGMNEAQTTIFQSIAEALAAPPPPEGEEASWLDWIRNLMSRAFAAFEVHSTPVLMPWEKSWWTRPWTTMALELVAAGPKGIGLDRMVEGGAGKTPLLGLAYTAVEVGGFTWKTMADMVAGRAIDAETNARQAVREASSMLGLWGRALNNFISPPRRKVVHDIRQAANAAGLVVEPPRPPTGFSFMSNTPTRAPLLNAAIALQAARTPEEKDAARSRLSQVAGSIYQRAYDRTIERGGFANEVLAAEAADDAGRRAVSTALSSLEPVTRALGRGVTRTEFEKLKATGVLDRPEVKQEAEALKVAADALSKERTPSRRPLATPTEAMFSPIKAGELGGGGGSSSGGGGVPGVSLGRTRFRKPNRLRLLRGRRPKAMKLPKLRKVKLAKAKKAPRLRLR